MVRSYAPVVQVIPRGWKTKFKMLKQNKLINELTRRSDQKDPKILKMKSDNNALTHQPRFKRNARHSLIHTP